MDSLDRRRKMDRLVDRMSRILTIFKCLPWFGISLPSSVGKTNVSSRNGILMVRAGKISRVMALVSIVLINLQALHHGSVMLHDGTSFIRLLRIGRHFLLKLASALIVDIWFARRRAIADLFHQAHSTMVGLGLPIQFMKRIVMKWSLLSLISILPKTISSQYSIWMGDSDSWALMLTYGWSENWPPSAARLVLSIDTFIYHTMSYGAQIAASALLCIICDLITRAVGRLCARIERMIECAERRVPTSTNHVTECQHIRMEYDQLMALVIRANQLFGSTVFVLFSVSFLVACSDAIYSATRAADFYALNSKFVSRMITSCWTWTPSLLLYWSASGVHEASSQIQTLVSRLFLHHPNQSGNALVSPDIFKPLELSIGGYGKIDRPFILGFLSSIITFSVMVIQFLPPNQ